MRGSPELATRWIAAILRWGALAAAALMLAGAALVAFDPTVPIQVGPPMPLAALASALTALNPYALMQAGVLLLLLTPLLRIVAAAVSFWLEDEPRYAWVSLAVLSIIFASLLFARTAH